VKVRQIRNATLIIDYVGTRFLIDPMLAEKGTTPPFPGTTNEEANPLVGLPIPVQEVMEVDAVIVTHTHRDHWDVAASRLLPKDMPMFVQHERDADRIRNEGFNNVEVLTERTHYRGISLVKTPGQHGSDEAIRQIGERLGEVCGIVFRHPDEQTLYLAGDTTWNRYVEDNLRRHVPDVIILNCGDAQIVGHGSIIMGKDDLAAVHDAAPGAVIVASHMDAVNHAMLSRRALRTFLAETGRLKRVLVPEDGETCHF